MKYPAFPRGDFYCVIVGFHYNVAKILIYRKERSSKTISFFSEFFVFVVAIVARFLAEVNGGKIPA